VSTKTKSQTASCGNALNKNTGVKHTMTEKGHCHSYDGAQWNMEKMFHHAPQNMFLSAMYLLLCIWTVSAQV